MRQVLLLIGSPHPNPSPACGRGEFIGDCQRQHQHMARQFLLVRLVLDEFEAVRLFAEHGVHSIHHRLRIAPREAVAQRCSREMFVQVFARHAEQARIGAAEAVDGLLGIADDEHGGLRFHRNRRIEPCAQYLPLQRIGVLELVQQHMAVAAVELVLHGLGVLALLQQAAQLPFQIGEIHLLLLGFERLITLKEGDAAMQHRLVEAIGLLLGLRVAHVLQTGLQIIQGDRKDVRVLVLGGLHLARLAGLREQQRPHLVEARFRRAVRPGAFHLARLVFLRLRSVARQLMDESEQHLFAVAAHAPVGDRIELHVHFQVGAEIVERERQRTLSPSPSPACGGGEMRGVGPPLGAFAEEVEQQLAGGEQAAFAEQPLHVLRFGTIRLLAHLLQQFFPCLFLLAACALQQR